MIPPIDNAKHILEAAVKVNNPNPKKFKNMTTMHNLLVNPKTGNTFLTTRGSYSEIRAVCI